MIVMPCLAILFELAVVLALPTSGCEHILLLVDI